MERKKTKTGGSVLFSYAKGKGDSKQAKDTFGTTCTMLLIFGVLLLLGLQCYKELLVLLGASGEVYIEAEKYSKIIVRGCIIQIIGTGILPILRNMGMALAGMCCMITGLVVNISVNYYLMMVVGLGIQGAAYGTVIAQSIVIIIGLMLLWRKGDYKICFGKNIKIASHILQSGVTPFGIYLAPSITLIFTNWQCIAYGGDAVVACYAVISYIAFPVMAMLSGVGDGTQPLISFYYGAGRLDEVAQVKKISYILITVIGGISTILTVILSAKVGIWFGLSLDAISFLMVGLSITAISFLIAGYSKFNISFLNATMRAKQAVSLTYLESLFVNPVLLFLLPLVMNVIGIWIATIVTAIIMLGIYMLITRKSRFTS
ncbi:MAG: MATE family efflux transporter [Eubacteriales bacterium]